MALQQHLFAALFLTASLAPLQLHAQDSLPRSTSTPYTGDLSIFEEQGRDEKLQIQRVLDILHVSPGKSVADIGAGGGWLTVRAAKRVGEDGRVYAEDINPAAVKAIEGRAAKEHLPQVRAVLGLPDDPKLPPDVLNAVVLLKVYHEIARPEEFMKRLQSSLAPGARIGIIDRNGNGTDHGLKQSIVEREMDEAGFREIEHYDFTKADGQDYFLVFVKN
jgi:cyclopropane fatty-acyl-phospholipid synthase-like methyltransferase